MSDLRFSLEQQLAAADGVLDSRPRRTDVGLVLLIDCLGQDCPVSPSNFAVVRRGETGSASWKEWRRR